MSSRYLLQPPLPPPSPLSWSASVRLETAWTQVSNLKNGCCQGTKMVYFHYAYYWLSALGLFFVVKQTENLLYFCCWHFGLQSQGAGKVLQSIKSSPLGLFPPRQGQLLGLDCHSLDGGRWQFLKDLTSPSSQQTLVLGNLPFCDSFLEQFLRLQGHLLCLT